METRLLVFLALAVLAAGCVDNTQNGGELDTARGLEVAELTVSDAELSPGQPAMVRLKLRNHHTEEISLNDVSLYNLGFLELVSDSDWRQRCSPTDVPRARQGFVPTVVCSWEIRAPEESEIGGFDSKSVSIKLNLDYDSKLSNDLEPYKVDFVDADSIELRQEHTVTYSNDEVRMTVSSEQPAPNEDALIDFTLESVGDGRVASEAYRMDYEPASAFEDCPNRAEVIVGDRAEFSCLLSGPGGTATQNLFISTSYKYVKAPNLDIEVVNQ